MIFVQRRTVLPNPELVPNGDFATDSDWTFLNEGGTHGWRISDGRAICDTNAIVKNRNINSSFSLVNGTSYMLTIDILQSEDNMIVLVGGTQLTENLPTGTNLNYQYPIPASVHSGGVFRISAGTNDLQEIDNVSIKLANPEIPKQNNLFVTISERLNLTLNTYLLLVFESDQQHTKSKTILNPSKDEVTLNERIDKLILTEGGISTETTDGTVKISVAGFWQYKIYAQTSATNLDERSSDIVRLLEEGKMTVTDTDELTTVEHTNQVTNFIHLNS